MSAESAQGRLSIVHRGSSEALPSPKLAWSFEKVPTKTAVLFKGGCIGFRAFFGKDTLCYEILEVPEVRIFLRETPR